jgi:Tol biopolymer transport system component
VAWLQTINGAGSDVMPAFSQRTANAPLFGPSIMEPLAWWFSPGADAILLIADDGTLQRWNVSNRVVVANNLVFGVQSIVPSPDGSQIAFLTKPDASGNATVGLVPTQGGVQTTVFAGSVVVTDALPIQWAPDGAHFAFESVEGTVYIAPASGGQAVPVLDSALGTAPFWLDNGHLGAAIRQERPPLQYRLGLYVAPVP